MGQNTNVNINIRAIDRVSRTIDRITRKFPKLTASVKKASRQFAILQARTAKLRRSLSKTGAKMRGFGRTMTLGATIPIGLAGAAMLRTGVNFQRAINRVGAVTRTIIKGKVTKDFERLEKQARFLGSTTEFSSTQVANAMALMGRAGFSTNEILASTDDVLALASASGMELAFTADVMAKTIRVFGLEANEATRVADVFAEVSRSTNVDLETLAETFKFTAPIARAYGATLEQTAALTGLLGDVGLQGSVAGTTLKNIFIKLATPSKRAKQFLGALGVTLSKTNGEMKTAGEILSDLAPKLGKLNKNKQLEVVNELFGLRGIAGASALMAKAMDEGRNPVAAMTELLNNSAGAAKDMRDIMLRGAPGALARFESALEGVGLAFADSGLLEAFADILDVLARLFKFIAGIPKPILIFISVLLLLVAAVGPLLIGLGAFLAIMPFLITAMAGLSIASLPVIATVLLIAAAVTAVIVAIGFLIFKWDEVKLAAGAVVDAIIDKFSTLPGALKAIFAAVPGIGFLISASDIADAGKNGKSPDLLGPSVGAGAATQNIANAQNSSQQAITGNIGIDFRNVPNGTQIRSEAEGPVGLNLGFAGGLQ